MKNEEVKETKVLQSVDDLEPEEQGGPIARRGFTYQDCIAAFCVLEMIFDESIVKIHCETHDDILVVREEPQIGRTAEYVQVKAGEPDKLWSLADILSQTKGKAGTSIFEKSFLRDKALEVSRFRFVTLRSVVSELRPLTYNIGHVDRNLEKPKMKSLAKGINKKFAGLKSNKNNGIEFWLENVLWSETGSQEKLMSDLLAYILKKSHIAGFPLLYEQAEKVLNLLLNIVKRAGDAKWEPDRKKKVIHRDDVLKWWNDTLLEEIENRTVMSGGKLRDKMNKAGFGDATINLAAELRRDYTLETLTPKYMDESEQKHLQRRVRAAAMEAQSQYEAGILDMTPKQFHVECQKRLKIIDSEDANSKNDRHAFLNGCLYDITDRCLFTFVRQE